MAALLQHLPATQTRDASNTEDDHDDLLARNFGRHVHMMHSRDETLENLPWESAFEVDIPEYDETVYEEAEYGEMVYGETEYVKTKYVEVEYGDAVGDKPVHDNVVYKETGYDEAEYKKEIIED